MSKRRGVLCLSSYYILFIKGSVDLTCCQESLSQNQETGSVFSILGYWGPSVHLLLTFYRHFHLICNRWQIIFCIKDYELSIHRLTTSSIMYHQYQHYISQIHRRFSNKINRIRQNQKKCTKIPSLLLSSTPSIIQNNQFMEF